MGDSKRHESLLFALIVIGVFLAWAATGYFLYDDQDRGTFGDMFGTVNALFSGLAFAGVIYAILLQRRELRLQREELELTRVELQGQKEQLAAQNSTLRKQNFETTFFQLLGLQNDIVNSIDVPTPQGKVLQGRDCFQLFYDRFKEAWGKNLPHHRSHDELERINKTYLPFFESNQSELGHYFRSLYNIVKLIDQSDVEDKRLYTNLVRAQLSSFELVLLFYNSLSDKGSEKFKPLIEKYSLLKTVPRNHLLNPPDHLPLYAEGAYGA